MSKSLAIEAARDALELAHRVLKSNESLWMDDAAAYDAIKPSLQVAA